MMVNYSFTQSRGGFFAGTYTKGNLIDSTQAELLLASPKSDVVGALNRVGNLWKGIKVQFDAERDAFIVLDELVMISNQNEAISNYNEFFQRVSIYYGWVDEFDIIFNYITTNNAIRIV